MGLGIPRPVLRDTGQGRDTAGSVDREQALHVKARSAHPAYPARAEVADADVRWPGSAEYDPVEFTHPVVIANDVTLKPGGWADPANPANPAIDWSVRESFEGAIRFVANGGAPINPRGRTGMHGRGLLGKWGPNHAADPIVTRFDPAHPDQLQVVVVVVVVAVVVVAVS